MTGNRKKLGLLVLGVVLAGLAQAWEYHVFDLSSGLKEAAWRDALAQKLGGRTEVSTENGFIDVLTDTQAIELDWPHKWHEGLGQALHYADATGKTGVLALISYSQGPEGLQEKSRQRFDMVERLCRKSGIELLVLFPSRPQEGDEGAAMRSGEGTGAEAPRYKYWLNTRTGVRHRRGCPFFENTDEGYHCGPDEGRPCSRCGG